MNTKANRELAGKVIENSTAVEREILKHKAGDPVTQDQLIHWRNTLRMTGKMLQILVPEHMFQLDSPEVFFDEIAEELAYRDAG